MLQELNIASENFTIMKKIGEGTFGIVLKAALTTSGEESHFFIY
jgi:hypothetical protein